MYNAKSVFQVTVQALVDGKIDVAETVEIKKTIAAVKVALRREADPDKFYSQATQIEAVERIIAAESPISTLGALLRADARSRSDVDEQMLHVLNEPGRANGAKLKSQLSTALSDRQIDQYEAADIRVTLTEGAAFEPGWLPGVGERDSTLATVARQLLGEAKKRTPLDALMPELQDKQRGPNNEELVRIAVLSSAATWSFAGSAKAVAEASRLSIKTNTDINVRAPVTRNLSTFHPDGTVTTDGERTSVPDVVP